MNSPLEIVLGIVAIAAIYLYWLPTAVALERQHHHRMPIIIVNAFLGWTFVGWVCALAWSASHVKPVPVPNPFVPVR